MCGRSTSKYLALLLALLLIVSAGGVLAIWNYATAPANTQENVPLRLGAFIFTPAEMPDTEVSLVLRLSDVLNRKYSTDIVTDSLDYLLNETIQVYWGGNIWGDPYVGSMDANFATQIDALFGDVVLDAGVSFLLKHQDLNGDGYREVALYSTSDPLDCVTEYDGTVCVYVTVFTPVLDAGKNIVGYNMVCESLRGYCSEVFYGPDDPTPSFSTDEWCDGIAYYHYFDAQFYFIPAPDSYDYNSYHQSYKYRYEDWDYWGSTRPYGNKIWQCLNGKIPWLS